MDVVVRGHDHRHLRREPDALAAGRLHRVVAGFGIEHGERGHRGPQHVHRMRIQRQTIKIWRNSYQNAAHKFYKLVLTRTVRTYVLRSNVHRHDSDKIHAI